MPFNAHEFMGKLAATYGDPSAFSELVFGTPFHAGQKDYAEYANADVNFLLPGNSWGKTEYIVRKSLYDAWFKEGPLRPSGEAWFHFPDNTLLASFEYDTIGEAYDRFVRYYQSRDEMRVLIASMTASPTPVIRLTNNSKIDFGSLKDQGKHVEATRYNRIYVDEAGHIPDISYTFDSVLFPRTMGVSGRIHLIGTPKPHSDPFLLEVFEKGKSGDDPFYYSKSGAVLENEFWTEAERQRVLRNPRYIKGWRPVDFGEELGLLAHAVSDVDGVPSVPILTPMGKQVILGAFIIAGGYFFNRHFIQRMFAWDGADPDWSGDSFQFQPEDGHVYMGAFDLAGNKRRLKGSKKKGSDPTVGFIIDYTTRPWRVACFDFIPGGDADWEDKYQLMQRRYIEYRLPYLIIDATGQQDSVQEALQNRGVEVEGIQFGGSSSKKFDMLRNLQLCTEMEWGGVRGVIRSPLIPQLKYEMDHYIIPDDDIAQDCVMALAMVAHEIAQCELPAPAEGEVW
jgi:hypothetical protein